METHLCLITVVYFIFALIAIVREIKRILAYRHIFMSSICKLMYVVLLVIVPGMMFCGYISQGSSKYFNYDVSYAWTYYVGAILTIVAYVMFGFGYKIKQRGVRDHYCETRTKVLLLSTLCIGISIISLVLWASVFCGISQLLIDANSIRAGFIGSSGGKTFFKHFVPLSLLSSFLLYNYLFVERSYERAIEAVYAFVLLVPSIFISFVYIIANDGRMLAGIYLLLFFMIQMKYSYEIQGRSLRKIGFGLLILCVAASIIIIKSDEIFRILKGATVVATQKRGFLYTITNEFSFIQSGLLTSIVTRVEETRSLTIVNDIINGLFAWLPTSLKPIIMDDVWDINTALLNSGSYGQAPTTIVAQSVYDLGIMGVFVIPAFYGFIIRKLENIIESYKGDVFLSTIYVVLGFYLGKGLAYFSLYNIMMNIFFIVFGCVIYWIVKRIGVKQ